MSTALKTTLCVLCLLPFSVSARPATPEDALKIWANDFQSRSVAGKSSPVAVTAVLETHRGKQVLVFQLTNISSKLLEFYPSELPWSRTNPLRIAAITINGRCLPNEYPISDPPLSENLETLRPSHILRGEIPLSQTNLVIDKLPATQSTAVLWSYCFSDATPMRYAPCSGVVVVPRSR